MAITLPPGVEPGRLLEGEFWGQIQWFERLCGLRQVTEHLHLCDEIKIERSHNTLPHEAQNKHTSNNKRVDNFSYNSLQG